MIKYEKIVIKNVKKGIIPEKVFLQFHHIFLSVEKVGDLSIFDAKKIKGNFNRDYYRIRKGNFRAIFYFEKKNIHVIIIGDRKEVYKNWE